LVYYYININSDNAILLHDSLPTVDCTDWLSHRRLFSYS